MTVADPTIPEPVRAVCTLENVALLSDAAQYIRELENAPPGDDVTDILSVSLMAEVYLNQPDLVDRFESFVRAAERIAQGELLATFEKISFHNTVPMLQSLCEATRRLISQPTISPGDKRGLQKRIIEPISKAFNELTAADHQCIEHWVETARLESMGLWIGKIFRETTQDRVLLNFTGQGEPGFTRLLELVVDELLAKKLIAPGVTKEEAWSVADSVVWRCVNRAADHLGRGERHYNSQRPSPRTP